MPDQLPYNERALLLEISAGAEYAFKIVFDKYWARVYVLTLGYLKEVPAAEDLTQDIFFSIWKNREKLKDIENFEHYLRAITRNRTISELRKNLFKIKRLSTDDFSGPVLPDRSNTSPFDLLALKNTSETLNEAIGFLPPRRQQVFRMSRLDGFTHAQISESLKISKPTINEHITEALIFIRTYLANHSDLLIIIWLLLIRR